jgi:hypothetical protein
MYFLGRHVLLTEGQGENAARSAISLRSDVETVVGDLGTEIGGPRDLDLAEVDRLDRTDLIRLDVDVALGIQISHSHPTRALGRPPQVRGDLEGPAALPDGKPGYREGSH